MKSSVTNPKQVYEMVDGKALHQDPYELVNGKPVFKEMGSSKKQARLIAQLVFLLMSGLKEGRFEVFTNELGLLTGPETRRSADIAVYEKLNEALDDEYAKTPPKIVIEVDVKVQDDQTAYLETKTRELLNFGVEQVIWILTQPEQVIIAEKEKAPVTTPWSEPLHILGIRIDIQQLLA